MKTKAIDNFAIVKTCKDGKLTAVASSEAIDRDGEIILASAWGNLDRFKANPVILAAHTHRSSDGSPTIIGSANSIEVAKGELSFEMTFARTPLAQQWAQLYEDGHARSFSVGFIPMDGEFRQVPCDDRRRRRDAQGDMQNVYVHTRVELLEISCVAVPANPEALARDFDPAEIERIVDARIEKALQRWAASRMLALID